MQKMCSDWEVYGFKKHGLTRFDCMDGMVIM